MWRGSAGVLAAVLALAGCKNTDTKSTDRDPVGTAASRTKGADSPRGQTWLDLPGEKAATDPGAGGPRDYAAPDCLAGRVLDPLNRPVQGAFIQVEVLNPPAGSPAPVGVYTDQNGVFYARGLKSGKAYGLTADATIEGKRYTAVVQTITPNPRISMVLRDDLQLPPGGVMRSPAGAYPSPAYDAADRIPPPSLIGPMPKPADGAWSPNGDGSRPMPALSPATPSKPTGTIPPPDDLTLPARPVARPENVADGPKSPSWPPPVAIPGPPAPPPSYIPPPPSPPPPPVTMGAAATGTGFVLVDTLGRNWDFPTHKSGSVVLLEFLATQKSDGGKNVPCLSVVPVLADFQARYAVDGLQVAGVVCDEWLNQKDRAAAAARFARDNNLNYQVFVEPGDLAGAVRDRFTVTEYPTVVLLDGSGRVLWKGHPNLRNELDIAIKRALAR